MFIVFGNICKSVPRMAWIMVYGCKKTHLILTEVCKFIIYVALEMSIQIFERNNKYICAKPEAKG